MRSAKMGRRQSMACSRRAVRTGSRETMLLTSLIVDCESSITAITRSRSRGSVGSVVRCDTASLSAVRSIIRAALGGKLRLKTLDENLLGDAPHLAHEREH